MALKRTVSLLSFALSIISASIQAQAQTGSASIPMEKQESGRRHSIGSSLFILGNLAPGDPPYYFQLNYGFQLAWRDEIVVEAITWTYYEPLGTYGSSEKKYPGKVRAYGMGLGYRHFYWRNLYSTVQATPFFQQFFDLEDKSLQNGFQLFLQLRSGYRLNFFKQRWFVEPSVVFNYWPINTNFPDSFREIERGKPNYFLFEPGMHFGFAF